MAAKPVKRRGKRRANGEGAVFPATRTDARTGKPIHYYRGYIELPELDAKGKPKRKWFTGATEAIVAKKVGDAIDERDAGLLVHSEDITLQAWCEHYFDVIAPMSWGTKAGARHNTIANYKRDMRIHVYPLCGSKKLKAELRAEHLEAAYLKMSAANLASSTIVRVHSAVHSALDEAVRKDWAARNVADLARVPGGAPAKEQRELTSAEAKQILSVLPKVVGGSRWLLALTNALRPGEYLGLEVENLDLEYGILWPRKQIQRQRAEHGCAKDGKNPGKPVGVTTTKVTKEHGCGEQVGYWETTSGEKPASMVGTRLVKELERPKPKYPCGKRQVGRCPQVIVKGGVEKLTYACGEKQPARCPQVKGGGVHLVAVKTKGSEAPLPLAPPVVEAIKRDMRQMKRARLEAGTWLGFKGRDGKEVSLVYAQPNGRPIEQRRDYDDWHDICRLAGVDPINPYASRHTAATVLVEMGVHPKVAQMFMRHSKVQTTLDIYSHAPAADVRAAADALAQLLMVTDELAEGTGTGN